MIISLSPGIKTFSFLFAGGDDLTKSAYDLTSFKKYSKEEGMKSYKSIMKKIHPDVSPELSRLASIVNEAKDVVIKSIDI